MRRIVTVAVQSTQGGAVDGHFDRIIKYIPTEIVGGWVALTGLLAGMSTTMLWLLFGVVAVLTWFWMLKQTSVPGQDPAIKQAAIAVVSFAVWAFALQSGPFGAMDYPETYGSIALIVYTLGIGLVP